MDKRTINRKPTMVNKVASEVITSIIGDPSNKKVKVMDFDKRNLDIQKYTPE